MNLELLFYPAAGVMAASLIVFYAFTSMNLKRIAAEEPGSSEFPAVSLIIPVAGAEPDLEPGLESILAQDHPDFELIIAMEDEADPARPIIDRISRKDSRVKTVLAGPAETCGQKNRNLLAGLDRISDETGIIVFADAGRMAGPGWLRGLVRPLAQGEAALSSGYHHFIPRQDNLSGSGKALCVLLLGLTRTIPFLNRSWGGATAITREAIDELGLPKVWSKTVVDDATLARLTAGSVRFSTKIIRPGLSTFDRGENWTSLSGWLTRQIAFFKTVFPGDWAVIGLVALWLNLAFFSSLIVIGSHLVRGGPSGLFAAAGTYLLLFFFLSARIRRFHPRPGSLGLWYAACIVAMPTGLWCFIKTCLNNRIVWRGKAYTVGWGGRVKRVSRLTSKSK